jgi:hypothetical protein
LFNLIKMLNGSFFLKNAKNTEGSPFDVKRLISDYFLLKI